MEISFDLVAKFVIWKLHLKILNSMRVAVEKVFTTMKFRSFPLKESGFLGKLLVKRHLAKIIEDWKQNLNSYLVWKQKLGSLKGWKLWNV